MKSRLVNPSTRGRVARVALLALLAVAGVSAAFSRLGTAAEPADPAPPAGGLELPGRTQCVPARKAIIAPAAPPHPVTEVRVALGQRVVKGQVLVKIDDDEARADLRAKEANLGSAIAVLAEARCRLEASEKAHGQGALAQEHYHDIRTAAVKAECDWKAAQAAVDAARAELEHFTVEAPIDGVINQLEVYRGTVSRPGTAVWGEILDLSEIDVRCQLTPEQVEQVAVGQPAEVRTRGEKGFLGKGRVVFIGLAAEPATGLIPMLVRLPNPEGRLRCQLPVQVRLLQPGG